MSDSANVAERMRADWNERAREDAHYYVAFGGRNQDEEAFLATAAEVVAAIEFELQRLPVTRNRKALEIGCGPGRLIKPLSRHFSEIHGVDVSDEMIGLARACLRGIPHAHVHATNGSSLDRFAAESFDIVYSYAVFQHIPDREVVSEYMREIVRVLKPGGVFRGQFNSLPPEDRPNTWSGVSFSPQELRDFTRQNGLQLLAMEGAHTQYLWTTWRKPQRTSIRRITNASSSEPVVPNQGPLAAISLWTMHLPKECDLNSLDVRVDGRSGEVVFLGPAEADGLVQVNAMLPPGTRTGLVPVDLRFGGAALCPPAFVRVIPAGPLVPRIVAVTDGINIVERNRSTSGMLKVHIDGMGVAEQVTAEIGGLPVRDLEIFCTDPLPPRYEVNFRLPSDIASGLHAMKLSIGKRALMPREVEVAVS